VPHPITLDRLAAFPELAAARAALEREDWAAVTRYFATLTDEVDIGFGVHAVVEGTDSGEFLRRVATSTGQPLARLLLGDWLICRGWESRTRAAAKYVSAGQFAGFFRHLEQAEAVLAELTADAPHNPNAWALRLMTARGLEVGIAETQRRYEMAARHHSHHAGAQLQLLQRLCPKWGGSFEASHDFARRCLETSPAGSSSGVVVAMAHIEQWMASGSGRALYMHRPAVRRELVDAARHSVLNPSYRRGLRWVVDHNIFAMALSLAWERRAAAAVFRALGRYADVQPWEFYLRSLPPGAGFTLNRALARGIGGWR
jgi:hypothetical protein